MKFRGYKSDEYMAAKYRSPYPVVESPVTANGEKVDFVASLGGYRYEIDGKMYSGELLLCMNQEVPK
jgi:hypothetical protein